MAAKQGLTAQLSQAGEDAKRAVLSRTVGTSHGWFSNLNTVCTIKSAPPKSPEVLELLSTKSGWLFKRNEQHVWQARWCCVVPHMFLYYFDAHSVPDGGGDPSGGIAATDAAAVAAAAASGVPLSSWPPPNLTPPTAAQQDEWNAAIRRDGLFKQHEKRGFSLFHSSTPAAAAAIPEEPTGEDFDAAVAGVGGGVDSGGGSGNNLTADHGAPAAAATATTSKYSSSALPQPAGIIDLECYTTVHRSRFSPNVLELAGDDQVNPDLRAFYFCATSPTESDDWSDALLNGRHSALLDEVDAYKQVCDGFAQQLQQLHNTVDTLQATCETSQQQVYHLRSKREDERRKSWQYLHETLLECQQKQKDSENNSSAGNVSQQQQAQEAQSQSPLSYQSLQSMRDEFLSAVDKERQNDKDAIPFVCDHTVALNDSILQLLAQNTSLQEQLATLGRSDQARVQELEHQVSAIERAYRDEKKEWTERLDSIKADFLQSQKELHDVQKELSHSKMQMTMYSSQQKNKTNLLNEHKRILKKEVIDLRAKLEDSNSQLSTVQHLADTSKLQLEQERQKNVLLERYISKVESQVDVQQNMMEMMSQCGGSQYGGGPPASVAIPTGGGGGGNGHGGIPMSASPNHQNNAKSTSSSHGGNDNTKNTGPTALDTTVTPISPTTGGGQSQSQHENSVQTADDDEVAEVLVPMAGQNSSSRGRTGNMALIDAMDDNKSHMSELTEDRTQRHFEAAYMNFNQQQHQQQQQPMPPITSATSPRMMMIRKLESPRSSGYSNSNRLHNHERPPSVILSGESNTQQQQQSERTSYNDRLETIHGSAHSLPPGPITPNFRKKHSQQQNSPGTLPRGNSSPRDSSSSSHGHRDGDAYTVGMDNSPYQRQQKLSVAHRSRLEADRGSTTPVRVRLDDEKVQESLQMVRSSAIGNFGSGGGNNASSSNAPMTAPSSNMSASGNSQGSGIWKRMEEAVLGPRLEDEEEDDLSSGEISGSSIHSTRVTDYTQESNPDNNSIDRFVQEARHRLQEQKHQRQQPTQSSSFRSSNRNHRPPTKQRSSDNISSNTASYVTEEKKVPELSPSLSLQERSQLLRAKQLKFLKDQGLIKDEQDIRGGAGAQSPGNNDTASVASSAVSLPRSAVSLPNAKLNFSPR